MTKRSNTISKVFSTLLEDGPASNTFYVYTSEHGRTLREDGSITSHRDDTKPEVNVPLMMIAQPSDLPRVDTQFRASHANTLATLLDLMKYQQAERKFAYSTSLLKAAASYTKPRFYYSEELQFAKPNPFD